MVRKAVGKQIVVLVALVAALVLGFGLVTAQEATPNAAPNTQSPFLGIAFNPATNGVEITSVAPGSPAETAGLQVGDIITKVDNQPVTAGTFTSLILGHQVGDTLSLDITRSGAAQTVSVTLSARPATADQSGAPEANAEQRPFLGIRLQDSNNGVTVSEVLAGSPAETAGLKVGDIIKSVNGTTVTQAQDVVSAVSAMQVGDQVSLDISRNGTTQTIQATLGSTVSLPPSIFGHGQPFNGLIIPPTELGVQFVPLDTQTAQQHNLNVTDGALITDVMPNTPAALAGLQPNDVVTAVDGAKVDTRHTLPYLLFPYQPGETVTLDVLRNGQQQQIQATLTPNMVNQGIPFPFGNFMPGFQGRQDQGAPEALPQNNGGSNA